MKPAESTNRGAPQTPSLTRLSTVKCPRHLSPAATGFTGTGPTPQKNPLRFPRSPLKRPKSTPLAVARGVFRVLGFHCGPRIQTKHGPQSNPRTRLEESALIHGTPSR